MEAEVRRFWKDRDIFARSVKQPEGRPPFVFYEGPPTANGLPGIHHVLARAMKDLFPRYKTMRGFYSERKGGWDTHGLPVEIEVEKQLKLNGKQDIERYGVEAFNKLCRESVFKYINEWAEMTEQMGFWVDLEHAYRTYDTSYMETVWWILKQLWDKELLYEGFKVVPYCPHDMTPLSSHELGLPGGYKDDVEDPSVYVKFELEDEPNTYFLAWTTTPWTLPGNVALAVGLDIPYVRVRQGNEHYILARARLSMLEGDYEVEADVDAKSLLGKRYKPLYEYLLPDKPAFFVVDADFVSTEDGTGIVHTAAAYGVDDLDLALRKGIPVRHVVDLQGRFRPEVTPFAGLFVKKADPKIIEDLTARGLMYRAETIRHTYPFCWRCGSPLRSTSALLRGDLLVHQDHGGEGPVDPQQQRHQLGARLYQDRPHGQLARVARRLVALPLAVLGNAAAGLEMRAVRRPALRRIGGGAGTHARGRPAPSLHRSGDVALREMRRGDASGSRPDRCVVRFRRDAHGGVSLPLRERGRLQGALPR